jgi:hypothetical protein
MANFGSSTGSSIHHRAGSSDLTTKPFYGSSLQSVALIADANTLAVDRPDLAQPLWNQTHTQSGTKMSSQDPIALTFKGPHKTWWYGGSIIAVVLGLIAASGGGDSDSLEVTRTDFFLLHDNAAIVVTNIGNKPIKITSMTVNDRDDCKVHRLFPLLGLDPNAPPSFPAELKIGDKAQFSSGCATIRTTITTDNGSYTYKFNR